MLKVQEYLRSGKFISDLERDFAIKATYSPIGEPLVILNYDMIDSPKHHPIVRECRGLTLEQGSWNVVARAFTRFFNAGEALDVEKFFDWQNFTAESKEDGSLILLYRYRDSWRVNTRGSFALGQISPGIEMTWEEAFYQAIDEVGLDSLLPAFYPDVRRTFVFEFCSPWNKVVRRYEKPTAFLLTSFHNELGSECNEFILDRLASHIRAGRPGRFPFVNLIQVREHLESQDDPTFEGVVLRDRHGTRIKVKNSRYVALHHLHGNGNIFLPKNLLPLVMKGEEAECLLHFPEVAENIFQVTEKVASAKARMLAVWNVAKGKKSQKDFALFVNKHTKLSGILFEARKTGADPKDIFAKSGDQLLKHLFSKGAA